MNFLKDIKFVNFRCFDTLNMSFNDYFTLLYGNNGIGKTSVLEGIYLLLNNKKLFKGFNYDLIKHNKDASYISVKINNKTFEEIYSLSIFQNERVLYKDEKPIKNIFDFNCFYFSSIVFHNLLRSRKERLNLLFDFMSLSDNVFANKLKKLKKLVELFNSYEKKNNEELNFIEAQIKSCESELLIMIEDFITLFNDWTKKTNTILEITLNKTFVMKKNFGIQTLLNYDLNIIGENGSFVELSQGQKKIQIITLILNLVRKTNTINLLLLDDVFEQLDLKNKNLLFETSNLQTIATSPVDLPFYPELNVKKVRLHYE